MYEIMWNTIEYVQGVEEFLNFVQEDMKFMGVQIIILKSDY
jgi:hypothetical protein